MDTMDIMERINMLKQCGFSTEEDHADLCEIVRIFTDEYNIPITEENAGVMITHIAAAFKRNRTGEKVEPLDREVYKEAVQSEEYMTANEIMDKIVSAISGEVSETEREFFIVHICMLLSGGNE